MDFDPSNNSLFIYDNQILAEHEGQWLITFDVFYYDYVNNIGLTATKSFVVNIYFTDPLLGLSSPGSVQVLSMSSFGGTVLQSSPKAVKTNKKILPFIADVTPGGSVEFGFPEIILLTQAAFNAHEKSAIRKLTASEEVILLDKRNPAVYQVFDTIDIMLKSSEFEEAEPVKVDWTMVDFDGQLGHLQMDLEKLQEQKVDLDTYDSIEITFNDAVGLLKSDDDKQVNFGEKLDWKLSPLVNKDTASRTEYIVNLWLSMICIGLAISVFLAIFEGSLISTWIFINSMQLIAHVPLISSKLPANAHYFFLNFMGLVRFNLETINSSLDTVSSKLLDY